MTKTVTQNTARIVNLTAQDKQKAARGRTSKIYSASGRLTRPP
nr:hypothetical protein [uncultured Campylobacter sp.]